MPSISQMATSSSLASSPSAKKRKRQQPAYTDAETHVKSNSPQTSLHFPDCRPLYNIELTDHPNEVVNSQQQRLYIIPRAMNITRSHDTKRQRIVLAGVENRPMDSHQRDTYEGNSSNNSDGRPNTGSIGIVASASTAKFTKPDLSACHICHQKPKVRSDLDSYADCEGCGMRTCYICMRECLGPSQHSDDIEFREGQLGSHVFKGEMSFTTGSLVDDIAGLEQKKSGTTHGWNASELQVAITQQWPNMGDTRREHKGMVCSRCCVERGADGEVRCLGCLRDEEGGELNNGPILER